MGFITGVNFNSTIKSHPFGLWSIAWVWVLIGHMKQMQRKHVIFIADKVLKFIW